MPTIKLYIFHTGALQQRGYVYSDSSPCLVTLLVPTPQADQSASEAGFDRDPGDQDSFICEFIF